MNQKMIGVVACFTVFLAIVLYFLGAQLDHVMKNFENFKIEEKSACSNEKKLYYEDDEMQIYTVCLDNLKISQYHRETDFDSFLKTSQISMDEFLKRLQKKENFQITVFTKNQSKRYEGENISILKCEKDEKKIFYIGKENISFSWCGE